MIVAHTLPKFLPVSEAWIYQMLKSEKHEGIELVINTLSRLNKDKFPLISVENIYHDISLISKIYLKFKSFVINVDPSVIFWQRELKCVKLDLLHNHFGWLAARALILAQKLKIPFVSSFYGTDVVSLKYLNNNFYKNYKKQLLKVFDKSDRIICTSYFLKEVLISQGVDSSKIKVIYLGVDNSKFKPAKKNKKDKWQLLSVGRLIRSKGQEYLLLAVAKILKNKKNIKLTLVGSGELAGYYKDLSDKLNISSNVEFKGEMFPDKLINLYQNSDIYIQPSIVADGREEAIGMGLVEAAACGLPLIGTNIGGIPEIVKSGQTGIIVSQKNDKALSQAILRLIDSLSLRLYLGSHARQLALSEFSADKQTKKIWQLYQEVIKEHEKTKI